jgi:hypothetical protein
MEETNLSLSFNYNDSFTENNTSSITDTKEDKLMKLNEQYKIIEKKLTTNIRTQLALFQINSYLNSKLFLIL